VREKIQKQKNHRTRFLKNKKGAILPAIGKQRDGGGRIGGNLQREVYVRGWTERKKSFNAGIHWESENEEDSSKESVCV